MRSENMDELRLPDFLVVGGMKAGTTTLKHYLRQHPDIFMAPTEVHFFDNEANYVEGVEWYGAQFREAHPSQLCGEKTPSYGYSEVCARRIEETLPRFKLVWIFRDPVERTYSNYWHAVNSAEEQRSFAEAVERELAGEDLPVHRRYVWRSVYADHVGTYLKYFHRESMAFLILEELNADPDRHMERLHRFLGVRHQLPPDLEAKHRTRIPRHLGLHRLLRRGVRSLLGRRIYRKIKRLNQQAEHGYPDMEPAVRARLTEYFRRHNERLFELIGARTDKWQKEGSRGP